jgi:TolB-like protein/DNA-binding winged helix-turn-helix (wHTH) protein/tetratricopeptide (TPR) repeat protein
MTAVEETRIYRFGLFEVDSRSGELRKQGVRLRVRGRPIEILLLLLDQPGDVVTRTDLRTRLWPADTFVDFDHGLHSAVNRLRDALGDSADNPRFIETLPRKGYRFIAPVTAVKRELATPAAVGTGQALPDPVQELGASPSTVSGLEAAAASPVAALADSSTIRAMGATRKGRVLLTTGLALAVAIGAALVIVRTRLASPSTVGPLTIAVLPFENLSGDPEQEFFSDGFTEEMIAELGMIGPDRLSVIGRTTSMLYKGARKSIGQIGQELGVTYLLEGSVRRSGSRMRVTAQLLDTKTMANLWSDSYDREVGDVLEVQTDVAQQIARSLAVALAPRSEPPTAPHSPSFTAYELYMRGRFFREQATEEGARKAIDYFERAIAIDPTYAAAHAAIADAYRLLGAPGWEVEAPSVLLTRAKTAAERALTLDPQSPEARAVLAMIKFNFEWDLDGAEREIKEALRLNPSFAQAHQYFSSILTCMRRNEDAIAAARRAVELDPLAPTATTSLGVRYYYANRRNEATEQFLKTLEVTPGFAVAHWGLAQIHRLEGRLDDQIDQLRTAVQLSGNSAYMRAHLAYGYAVAGDRTRAEALRREIEAESAKRYLAPYHLALIDVGLGDHVAAVRSLERAYADRSGWLVFLPVEPEFDVMRETPEFKRLIARVKPQA